MGIDSIDIIDVIKKSKYCDHNTWSVYQVLCVLQYNFNILVNSQLASINTNSTLLATSSSTCVKGTKSRKDSHVKAAIETDATSGKKKLYKNFIYNKFTLTYASAYIEKNGTKCQRI